jgi:hypothetical protein
MVAYDDDDQQDKNDVEGYRNAGCFVSTNLFEKDRRNQQPTKIYLTAIHPSTATFELVVEAVIHTWKG